MPLAQAWAGPSPKHLCNQALRTRRIARSLQRERAQRLDWLARLRSLATSLQNQDAGPARNFRLRAVLAEAREVAQRLKELDKERRHLLAKAKNLLAAMARTAKGLAAKPQGELQSCMAGLRSILPRPKTSTGHLAQVVIRPDDGPAELERKADLLADSADKLERRMRRLRRAIRRTERQVALQAAAGRAQRGGSLLTGQRRRSIATVTPAARVQGTTNPTRENGRSPTVGGTDHNDQPNEYGTLATNGPVSSSQRHTNPEGLTQSWNSVLSAVRDLMGPAQADALAGQAASPDPAVRLAALRRAVKLLGENRRRLQRRARRLRAQARRLTGPRPGPGSRRRPRQRHP